MFEERSSSTSSLREDCWNFENIETQEKQMRHFRLATIGLFVIACFTATAAVAQSPHFIGTATVTGIGSDGTISVKFKEAGVGNNQLINYSFSGSFTADYGCINHGGNHPSASNKTFVADNFSVSGTFSSGKNGAISATLSFTPPDPDSILNCPGNQFAVLADISYSGLSLSDSTNGVDATLSTTSLGPAVFFTF